MSETPQAKRNSNAGRRVQLGAAGLWTREDWLIVPMFLDHSKGPLAKKENRRFSAKEERNGQAEG
jgi:hypothetical protein